MLRARSMDARAACSACQDAASRGGGVGAVASVSPFAARHAAASTPDAAGSEPLALRRDASMRG